jgi:hypothetical protein
LLLGQLGRQKGNDPLAQCKVGHGDFDGGDLGVGQQAGVDRIERLGHENRDVVAARQGLVQRPAMKGEVNLPVLVRHEAWVAGRQQGICIRHDDGG